MTNKKTGLSFSSESIPGDNKAYLAMDNVVKGCSKQLWYLNYAVSYLDSVLDQIAAVEELNLSAAQRSYYEALKAKIEKLLDQIFSS